MDATCDLVQNENMNSKYFSSFTPYKLNCGKIIYDLPTSVIIYRYIPDDDAAINNLPKQKILNSLGSISRTKYKSYQNAFIMSRSKIKRMKLKSTTPISRCA